MAVVPLYAVAIHEACGKGDLPRMKELVRQAEEHIREWGNIPAALEALKIEVAKLEAKQS